MKSSLPILFFLSLSVLALTAGVSFAQTEVWESSGVLYPTTVTDMAIDRATGDILAATINGVYRSTDHGITWEALDQFGYLSRFREVAFMNDGSIWGVTYSTVWEYAGNSWRLVYELSGWPIYDLEAGYNPWQIFMGWYRGIMRSDDGGDTWSIISGSIGESQVFAVEYTSDGRLYVGSDAGVFISYNEGDLWNAWNEGLGSAIVNTMGEGPGGTIWAGTDNGVYYLSPTGTEWHAAGTGTAGEDIYSISVSGTEILVGAVGKALYSSDGGATWTEVWPASSYAAIIAKVGLLVGGGSFGVRRSTNGGSTWSDQTTLTESPVPYAGIPGEIRILEVSPSGYVLAASTAGIHRSTDAGATWSPLFGDRLGSLNQHLATGPGGVIYATTRDWVRNERLLCRSDDDGDNWTTLTTSLPLSGGSFLDELGVNSNGDVFAAFDHNLYRSTDAGQTWTSVMPRHVSNLEFNSMGVAFAVDYVDQSIWRSTDFGDSWTALAEPVSEDVSLIHVGPDDRLYALYSTGVYVSTDDGDSWSLIHPDSFTQLATGGASELLLNRSATGMTYSSDNGASWSSVGCPNRTVLLPVGDASGIFYAATGSFELNEVIHHLPCGSDADVDWVCDADDNCPSVHNGCQEDMDSDLIGDICDPDLDGDGIAQDGDASGTDGDAPCVGGETANCDDNCPEADNADQADADSDGIGDLCDQYPECYDYADADGDGVPDGCDACEGHPDFLDTDGDTVPDGCDICDGYSDLQDDDWDGIPDGCDPCRWDAANDQDGDGLCAQECQWIYYEGPELICWDVDNCPADYNPDQYDLDSDNSGDLCDNCPFYANYDQSDIDEDGIGDACTFTIETPSNAPSATQIVLENIQLTFDQVTTAGESRLMVTSQGEPLTGYIHQPSNLSVPLYYDLSTTATYEGSIQICIDYSALTIDCQSADCGPYLVLLHWDGEEWLDRTETFDAGTTTICGTVTGLSPFALGLLESCCVGRVGDANGQGGDEPTISDISVIIDAKFITGTCDGVIACLAEADVNQSGGVYPGCGDITISDIATLIDYLFITGPETATLPDCL